MDLEMVSDVAFGLYRFGCGFRTDFGRFSDLDLGMDFGTDLGRIFFWGDGFGPDLG